VRVIVPSERAMMFFAALALAHGFGGQPLAPTGRGTKSLQYFKIPAQCPIKVNQKDEAGTLVGQCIPSMSYLLNEFWFCKAVIAAVLKSWS